jgi:hypothetical protein
MFAAATSREVSHMYSGNMYGASRSTGASCVVSRLSGLEAV